MTDPSRLRPVMLIGLGSFGLRVLEQMTTQAVQAYGRAAALALIELGVDVTAQPTISLPADVSYRSLNNNLDDLISTEDDHPAFLSWFNWEDHRHELHTGAQAAEHPQDRQLARLALFAHLHADAGLLLDLRARLHQTRDAGAGRAVRVYIVAALHDGISALVIDTAILVRRIAAQEHLLPPRLVACLATPDALLPAPNPRVLAQTYAAWREIRRFTYPGDAPPYAVHYSAGAGDPIRHGEVEHLFDSIQVYSQRPSQVDDPPGALAAIVADTLLAQCDYDFGEFLADVEENLKNEIMDRQEKRADHTLPPELYINLYQASAALFPRQMMLEAWSPRLAVEALRRSLSIDAGADDVWNLLGVWANNHLSLNRLNTSQPARCPRLIAQMLGWFRQSERDRAGFPEQLADWSAAELERLITLERLTALRETHQADESALGWQPSTAADLNSPGAGPESLRRDVIQHLLAHFGSFEHDEPRGGQYVAALQPYIEWHTRQFEDSLYALALHALNTPGSGLAALGGAVNTLVALFKFVQETAKAALQIRQEKAYITFGNMPDKLDAAGRNVERIYHPLRRGKLDEKTERFLRISEQIADQLRAESVLAALLEVTARFQQAATRLNEALAPWLRVLILERNSLWQQVTEKKTAVSPPVTYGRYLLIDQGWMEARYRALAAPGADGILDSLARRLQWQVNRQSETLTIEADLGGRPLKIATQQEWSAYNRAAWEAAIADGLAEIVQQWDIWKYLLDRDARYTSVQRLAQAISGAQMWDGVRRTPGQTWKVYLMTPSLETGNEQHAQIVTELIDGLHPFLTAQGWTRSHLQHEKIVDYPQLTLLASGKMIALRDLAAFERWETAYQDAFRYAENLHVFSAEQNACFYERERLKHLDMDHQLLDNTAVQLLEQPACLVEFIWADAVGLVEERPTGALHYYTLALPDYESGLSDMAHEWILNEPTANAIRLDALVGFCAQAVSENRPSPTAIPLPLIQRAVQQEIQIEVAQWKAGKVRPPESDIWHWAQGLDDTSFYEAALEAAFAHDFMRIYSERLEREYHALPALSSPKVRDLLTILLTIAKQEQSKKRTAVHKMGP